jgi:hypothetical protein
MIFVKPEGYPDKLGIWQLNLMGGIDSCRSATLLMLMSGILVRTFALASKSKQCFLAVDISRIVVKKKNSESTPTASCPLGRKPTEVFYALSEPPSYEKKLLAWPMLPYTGT